MRCAKVTRTLLSKFVEQRLSIEANEPPTLKVLDALCHNDEVRASSENDPEELIGVTSLQRLLAQVVDVGAHSLRKGDS